MKLHRDVAEISYRHKYEIGKVFKDIIGIHGIEHFSLDLVRPDGEMLFFSGTPAHGYSICKEGFAPYDGIISPEYYVNNEFYWWKDAPHRKNTKEIKKIRESILGLKHGFMLVRRWNDFYLIYSFATKKLENQFTLQVLSNLNEFLRIGDYAYMELMDTYANYCGLYNPPAIEKFYKLEGGKPPARYTSDYRHMPKNIIESPPLNDVIIYYNFRK